MPYTIGELKKDIADLPDDMPIVKQADDEGNSYEFVSGIDGFDGDKQNFFNKFERECMRREDLDDYGYDESDLVACAVIW